MEDRHERAGPSRFRAPSDVRQSGLVPGYMSGFGNSFETEALAGALPVGRNSPQKVIRPLCRAAVGLAFTAPQASNQRSWLYRIRPTVKHSGRYKKIDKGLHSHRPVGAGRERPADRSIALGADPDPDEKLTFVSGLRTMTTAGDAETQAGMAAHVLFVTASMQRRILLQCRRRAADRAAAGQAALAHRVRRDRDRAGRDLRHPARHELQGRARRRAARGYVCENYGADFTLPERGPIGANCLANPRDFLTPVAAYEDKEEPSTLFVKWGGELYAHRDRPFAARCGRLARQLRALQIRSAALLAGRRDAVRPSRSVDLHGADRAVGDAGTANVDFVIFPERWLVAENTFRPPWYPPQHDERVHGPDLRRLRRQGGGLRARAASSLHNCMLPHGPDERGLRARQQRRAGAA